MVGIRRLAAKHSIVPGNRIWATNRARTLHEKDSSEHDKWTARMGCDAATSKNGRWRKANGLARAIKANSLKIFVGVNPTFFSVNTDLDPDIVANAQPDSALFFFPRHKDLSGENFDL
jgi:hypothetical protein